MFLSHRKYAVEILERAHMVNFNPSRTPVDTESKLGDDGDPVADSMLYQSLAGSLQYFNFNRPDISYAVQQICLCKHDPREPHFSTLKRILFYVRSTLDYGLQFFILYYRFVAASQVRVLHVPSRYQYADIFTKGLSSSLFEEFRTSLSVWCPPVR
ncbi:ribonuclease H-like domain-containing protein [Tanacetum coccineum]